MEGRAQGLFRLNIISYCFLPVLPRPGCLGSACVHTGVLCSVTFASQFIKHFFNPHPQLQVSCPLLWTVVPLADLCSEEVRFSLDGGMIVPLTMRTGMNCAVARLCSGCVASSVLELLRGSMGESVPRYFSP